MKVALFGKIRSGKDTVGELLIKEYGCTRVAFGDGIKTSFSPRRGITVSLDYTINT